MTNVDYYSRSRCKLINDSLVYMSGFGKCKATPRTWLLLCVHRNTLSFGSAKLRMLPWTMRTLQSVCLLNFDDFDIFNILLLILQFPHGLQVRFIPIRSKYAKKKKKPKKVEGKHIAERGKVFFHFFQIKKIIVTQLQLYAFSPIPPSHPGWTHLPPPPLLSPLILSMCPL